LKPLILLHGALGAETQLNTLKQALSYEGFVVYTLNFSGHGGSPFKNEFGIETFANDLLIFMELNGIQDADIFGYSMGGYVALWFAYLNADKVGRIVTLGTKFDWTEASALHEIKKLDPEKILEKIPAFARLLETRHAPNDWKLLMNKTADMMLQLGAKPVINVPVLERIKNEVLILLGDKDDMADREFSITTSRQLPNGEFMLLSETPHPIEKIDLKNLQHLIKEFLRG
jgi:pimeloyl-ACP methyl ester carboxylesterase